MSEEREKYERLCELRGFKDEKFTNDKSLGWDAFKTTGKTELLCSDPSFVMEYSYKDDTRTSMTIKISSQTEIPDKIAEKVFELMTSKAKQKP